MSVEPSPPLQPGEVPSPRRSPLLPVLLGLLILLLLGLAGVTLLPRTQAPAPGGTPAPAAATPTAPALTGSLATVAAGGATTTAPPGTAATGIAAGVATATEPLGPPATGVAGGATTPGLPVAQPSAGPSGVLTRTLPVAQPSTGPSGVVTGTRDLGGATGTPAAVAGPGTPSSAAGPATAVPLLTANPPPGITVVDSTGTAYACARTAGCGVPAAPDLPVYPGGEARTGADGGLRLASTAGLLVLGPGTTLQVATLDDVQATVVLTGGQVLARAAAGRTQMLTVRAAGATVSGAGTTFGVALLPDGGVRVAAPADAARPVHVQAPGGAKDAEVAAGQQVLVSASGDLGAATPLDAESGALLALGGPPPGTPAAAVVITTLPVPTFAPLPGDVVTATIVLTPPPEHTLVPVTILPLASPPPPGVGTGTAAPGTVAPGATVGAALPGTLVPGATAGSALPGTVVPAATAGGAALLPAALTAMGGLTSYTFGATRGSDPATAEFSAGTVAADTACWIATVNGQRTDYQVRGGIVFSRPAGGTWQQQPGTTGLPAWLTYWQLLGQVDPATVADLGATQMDAVDVRHLRAHLLPAAGQGTTAWMDAFVGTGDHLVRGLVLYVGDPANTPAIFKIGFSSFGAPLSCPPLTQP